MRRFGILNVALITVALVFPAMGVLAQPPNAPFAKGPKLTVEQALKEAPKTDKSLLPLDKAFYAAEAKMNKNPKDAKAKLAYVEAAYKYGHATMMKGNSSPKVMYRAALALFRRALKVDPKHKKSLEEKKVIEDIYATMPSGIPK